MERRKFIIGAGALAAGTSAAVGSGAFSAAQVRDREANIEVNGDDGALIQLHPGHEVRESSTVDDNRVRWEDGQLLIDFDDSGSTYGDGDGTGVGPNSVYQVGAISGNNNLDNIDYEHGESGDDLTDDILYGSAVGDSEGTSDDPAFVIRNESDQDYDDVILGWDGDAPDREDGVAAMTVSRGGATSFAMGFGPGEDHTSFTLPAGSEASVSLIVSTGDIDPEDDGWEGSLVLNVRDSDTGDRFAGV